MVFMSCVMSCILSGACKSSPVLHYDGAEVNTCRQYVYELKSQPMSARQPCQFKPLTTPADSRFDELCAIYSNAIPASGQKSVSELSAMVSRPDYRFLLAQEGTAVVGFSISFVPGDESCCLLEYMAIHERCRNRGLGKRLFRETVKTVQKEYIVVEVD